MKFKNVISLCVAVTMASTMVMSLAFTASAAVDKPTINVYSINVAEEQAKGEYTDVPVLAGYDSYLVNYTVEGVDVDNNQISAITIDFSVSDMNLVNEASFKKPVTNPPALRAKNGIYSTYGKDPMTFSSKQINFTSDSGIEIYDWVSYTPPGESKVLISTIWYVEEGKSVDITYNTVDKEDSIIITAPYGSPLDQTTYYADGLAFNKKTITLGSSAPADPVGTEIATGVYYAGNVDTTTKTLTDDTTFSISYNGGEPKVIAQTLAQILGGEGIAGNLTGKLHFAIKPVSVEASTLDFSKFVINVN